MTNGDGFLLVDKPAGCTSHDVVAAARRRTGVRKIGHAGTLDPMATGLLVLGVGRATRLLRFVQDQPKEYRATATFGVATDSLDADGAVVSREPLPVHESEVEAVLGRFTGPQMQVPPMVSAKRVDGTRLYELARRGVDIERQARPIVIHELELIDFAPSDYPEVSLRVVCSTGTYVRSLADDIARALGGRAHLTELRRTAIGTLTVDSATPLDAVVETEDWAGLLLDSSGGLPDMQQSSVDDDLAEAISHGIALPSAALGDCAQGPVKILGADGSLLAVYDIAGNRAAASVVLA